MKRIILKPGEEDRILSGHPWVYDNEVALVLEGSGRPHTAALSPPDLSLLKPGELADVEVFPDTVRQGVPGRSPYLGRALVNPRSKIVARIYSPSKEGVDKGFFKHRLRAALDRRSAAFFGPEPGFTAADSLRLVFAEADFLPGLIVDRFAGWPFAGIKERFSTRPGGRPGPLRYSEIAAALGPPSSWLAIQFLSFGMDSRRELVLDALEEVLNWYTVQTGPLGPPAGIVEKSGARVRELEGLPPREGILRGNFPVGGIVIFENGCPFLVNLPGSQKTGHFLDQKENRLAAARHARFPVPSGEDPDGGSAFRVLDLFSYTGGFAIQAACAFADGRGGPKTDAAAGADAVTAAGGPDLRERRCTVTAVDASAAALETLKVNAWLNGVEDTVETLEADVFDLLPRLERQKEKYDLVILDPPAFAKSRTVLTEALRGYREINRRAIGLLVKGGVLVTCSCSQALDEGRFRQMIALAAADAERRLHQLEFRYQGADHPVLAGYDESLYLKCGIYRAL
jgi:23S rRNA (cytosine1962-C5)-methyltransferase